MANSPAFVGAIANVYVSREGVTRVGHWKASREECIETAAKPLPPGIVATLICRVRVKALKNTAPIPPWQNKPKR
jgi:hypothetical protein